MYTNLHLINLAFNKGRYSRLARALLRGAGQDMYLVDAALRRTRATRGSMIKPGRKEFVILEPDG